MPVPEDIANEVLVSCGHYCCRCGRRFVQIHHMDKDETNNDKDNLIPLCKLCHEEVHSIVPFARKITQAQLRMYRENWIEKMKIVPETPADIEKGQKDLAQRVANLEQAITTGGTEIE